MAYVDQRLGRNHRAIVTITVAILQGAAVVALISGLSVTIIDRPPLPRTEGVFVPLDPLPPKREEPLETPYNEPSIPRPAPLADSSNIPYTPPVDVRLPPPPPTDSRAEDSPSPPSTPLARPRAVRPKGDPTTWVTPDDYPARDLREGNQGTVYFKLTVRVDGRVQSCTITGSSGFARLDNTTCRNLLRSARFHPATDANGNPVVSEYSSAVRWVIPE